MLQPTTWTEAIAHEIRKCGKPVDNSVEKWELMSELSGEVINFVDINILIP